MYENFKLLYQHSSTLYMPPTSLSSSDPPHQVHDACIDNTLTDYVSSVDRLAMTLKRHLGPQDMVVWRTTSAVHPQTSTAEVLSKTEYKNSMNYERTRLFASAGAHVMAYHGFIVLDVFPLTAAGESHLLPNDIRHYTTQMYHTWAHMLVTQLCVKD